jgi:hypothetical protein
MNYRHLRSHLRRRRRQRSVGPSRGGRSRGPWPGTAGAPGCTRLRVLILLVDGGVAVRDGLDRLQRRHQTGARQEVGVEVQRWPRWRIARWGSQRWWAGMASVNFRSEKRVGRRRLDLGERRHGDREQKAVDRA